MRKTMATIAALSAVAAVTLSACSSSGGGGSKTGGNSGGSTGGKTTGSTASGKVQVGVILPDTTSSTRYTQFDAPLLTKAFNAAGIKSDVQNAGGSTSKYTSIAQSMIGEGIKVLIMDSIDATSGAAVEASAQKSGVKVIDYDRINLGGTAPYYVSYDNEAIGKQQATTLVSCLSGVSKPRIIEMDGGTDVDNNAVLFKKGAGEVFGPAQAAGKLSIVSKTTVKGWDVNLAAPAFTQALTAAGSKIDGVYAANDDIANAVIGVLKSKGLAGKVQVSGQDSGVEGLQNILRGDQCMTIFKNYALEADAASKLAIALINGKDIASSGVKLTKFDDPKAPSHDVQAYLLPTQAITIKNVEDVVTAKSLTAAQICKGIASLCAKHGVK